MHQRNFAAIGIGVLGTALALLRGVDAALWCDTATGFAVQGSAGVRIGVWLVALVLPFLLQRCAAPQPLALQERCTPLGLAMLAAGGLLAACGAATLVLCRGVPFSVPLLLDAALPCLAGLWLLVYGVRALRGFGIRHGRLGSPWLSAVLLLCLLWKLLWRFHLVPASIARLPCTLRVFSAAAVLLFATMLLKVFLVPGLPCGKTLFATGGAAFCAAFGLEPPQVLVEASAGMLALPDLLYGLAMGALGVCGLVCALAACGPDATAGDGLY